MSCDQAKQLVKDARKETCDIVRSTWRTSSSYAELGYDFSNAVLHMVFRGVIICLIICRFLDIRGRMERRCAVVVGFGAHELGDPGSRSVVMCFASPPLLFK